MKDLEHHKCTQLENHGKRLEVSRGLSLPEVGYESWFGYDGISENVRYLANSFIIPGFPFFICYKTYLPQRGGGSLGLCLSLGWVTLDSASNFANVLSLNLCQEQMNCIELPQPRGWLVRPSNFPKVFTSKNLCVENLGRVELSRPKTQQIKKGFEIM